MDKRKIYILGGIAALLIIMVVGFLYYGSVVSKNSSTGTQAGTGPSTTGTGGLGSVPPAQTNNPPTRPSPPVLHTDPSQPYAITLPRQKELAPTPTPVGSGVPLVTPAPQQAVNPAGMDNSLAFQYNDLTSLNENQLMQKYTPGYQAIDQTFQPSPTGGANGIASNGTDGVVTVAAAPPVTSIPSVALPAGVTFTINQQNDPQSLTNYLAQLNSTIAPFDISNPSNSTLISSAVTDAISNPTAYKADVANGQNMLAQLQALPVPSSLAGLQESYYDLYSKYNALIADAAGISSTNVNTQIAAGTAVQQDAAKLGASLETTLEDQGTAQVVIGNVGSGTLAASGSVQSNSTLALGAGAQYLQVSGYSSSTGQHERTPNVVSLPQDDYAVLIGLFASSGNLVSIDGIPVTVAPADQNANEIDVAIGPLRLGTGTHTATVNPPGGTSVSQSFTVTGSGGGSSGDSGIGTTAPPQNDCPYGTMTNDQGIAVCVPAPAAPTPTPTAGGARTLVPPRSGGGTAKPGAGNAASS